MYYTKEINCIDISYGFEHLVTNINEKRHIEW